MKIYDVKLFSKKDFTFGIKNDNSEISTILIGCPIVITDNESKRDIVIGFVDNITRIEDDDFFGGIYISPEYVHCANFELFQHQVYISNKDFLSVGGVLKEIILHVKSIPLDNETYL